MENLTPATEYTWFLNRRIYKLIILIALILITGGAIIFSLQACYAAYFARESKWTAKSGEWKKAAMYAKRAVGLQPWNADYRQLLALSLERQGSDSRHNAKLLEAAACELKQAIGQNPVDGDLWIQLARVTEKSEMMNVEGANSGPSPDTPTADVCFRRALELDPQNIYYMVSAAAYYARRGDSAAAEVFIARAWEISPNTMARYYLTCEQRQEELDRVVESYLSGRLAACKNDAKLFCWLGGLYEARKQFDLAYEVYRSGLDVDADRFKCLIRRVKARSRKR